MVDVAPGQPFEAHFVDLNNDGKLEIIASAFDTRYAQSNYSITRAIFFPAATNKKFSQNITVYSVHHLGQSLRIGSNRSLGA